MILKFNFYYSLIFIPFITLLFLLSDVYAEKSSSNEKTIVFIGDSLTEGYGIDEQDTYVSLLKEKWEEQDLKINIINGSVSGSTSSSAIPRLRWFERVSPTHVVLALGANDGLRGLSIKKTKENLTEAIEWSQEREIHVVLAGMLMPPNYGDDYTSNFKKMYESLSELEGVSLIPFLLEGVATVEEHNLPDGIHPNESGHKVMMKTVEGHLKKVLGVGDE